MKCDGVVLLPQSEGNGSAAVVQRWRRTSRTAWGWRLVYPGEQIGAAATAAYTNIHGQPLSVSAEDAVQAIKSAGEESA